MSLKTYDEKRDFEKTSEPKGEKKSSDDQLIFVVQKHDASRLHYDFRLEWEGVLLSWAVPKGPSYNPKDKRLAVMVEDHPYDYKDFEGTIPQGEYGGGTVMLWDEGTWEPQEGEDFAKGLKSGSLKIILYGERLQGKWALVRMKPKPGEEDKNWLLIKERDELAQDVEGMSDFTTSVRTNRTMAEITQEQGVSELEFYEVQKATLKEEVPKGDNWIHELKYDGYRIGAYINHGEVKLLTRNRQDYTKKFPAIVKELEGWDIAAVIDGEVIVQVDGKSSFQALQQAIKNKKSVSPSFMVFDLLYDGEDIRQLPLKERRERLEKILKQHKSKTVQYSRAFSGDPSDLLEQVCAQGMEGIISKRIDKPYTAGRNRDWLKIKCRSSQELVIVGFTQTEKRTRALSALLLGVYEGEDIRYAGRVGTGFTESSAKELHQKLKSLIRKTSPLNDPPKERSDETITWVRPALIAEVDFAEWTEEGLVRQASYKGLRSDKSSEEVVQETPSPKKKKVKAKPTSSSKKKSDEAIELTSPEKKMVSDYTKEDLANYYAKISQRMLPFVKDRLLSLVRCPEGITGECFYQKNYQDSMSGLESKRITQSDGEEADYIYLSDADGLRQAVQLSTIEFHGWGSRIDALEKPDMIVFDLDPDEGMDLKQVRQGVRDLKQILDQLDLRSFLKTSGGKGYHVVIPLTPQAGWDEVRDFSKNVALAMEQKWPDRYTSNMRKEKRKGKIYVDWVRNGRGATSVAPYSVRARDNAPVSWPIAWEDLSRVAPNDMTIKQALRSRKADPWKDFFSVKQKLK